MEKIQIYISDVSHASTKTFYPKLHIFICFSLTLLVKHYYGDPIKVVEMGRASGMYTRKGKYIQDFGGKT
jgi:hypothetical protein